MPFPGLGRRVAVDGDGSPRSSREAEPGLPPLRMRGREPAQTYGVAAILGFVGVLDLLVTTGPGAAKHPALWESWVGIALAAGLAVSVRWRSRMVSPFFAIVAAFFVTTAKAPTALSVPHLVALLAGLGYALALSLRQRRDQKALQPARASAGRGRGRGRGRDSQAGAEAAATKRPAANRRYTPPKGPAKATRTGRS